MCKNRALKILCGIVVRCHNSAFFLVATKPLRPVRVSKTYGKGKLYTLTADNGKKGWHSMCFYLPGGSDCGRRLWLNSDFLIVIDLLILF